MRPFGNSNPERGQGLFYENNIPLITAYGDIRIWAKMKRDKLNNIFIAYPDYEDESRYLTNYAVKKLSSRKIALFYQNDDYGKMAMSGIKKALAGLANQAKYVAGVPYEVTERAMSAHSLKLKESGADAIIIYAKPTHSALIAKEIAKIGYRPKMLTTFTLGDPIMYKLAGKAWEGAYIALPGNSGMPGHEPEADRIIKIIQKYNPKIAGKEYLALFGAISVIQLAKGLENAGRNLTPETLIKGMEKIKNWKPEGVGSAITYEPGRRHGNNASRISQARNGKIIPLEPFTNHKAHF